MLVSKEFTFDAAHHLTKYHGKCEHVHGHTYRLQVTVEGEVQENGLVIDFVILKKIVKDKVLAKYDHRDLNEYFENPTAEVVLKAIWDELVDLPSLLKAELENPNMPDDIKRLLKGSPEGVAEGAFKKEINEKVRLHELRLWETPTSYVTYRGE